MTRLRSAVLLALALASCACTGWQRDCRNPLSPECWGSEFWNDQVRVTELVAVPSNPDTGAPVTIRMTIQNVAGRDLLGVPVGISVNDFPVFSDTVDIVANGEVQVSRPLVAGAGLFLIKACADPANTLGELLPFANNCQEIDLTHYDQVRVTELVATPSSPVDGDLVTVRMVFQNVSGRDLSRVPVEIRVPILAPRAALFFDTVDIPSGGVREVSWQFVNNRIGLNKVTGCVDSSNTLAEPSWGNFFANNCRVIDLTQYETQELDYQQAARSGAGFRDGREGLGTCAKLGQGDAKRWETYGVGLAGVVFVAHCPYLGSFFVWSLSTGGKADPEAFQDFQLRNDWTVKSFDLKFLTASGPGPGVLRDSLAEAQASYGGGESFEFTPPQIGSNNPFLKGHLGVGPDSFLLVYVKVLIQGPRGTSPYGPVTKPCFSGYSGSDGIGFQCALDSDCQSGYTCFGGCGCMRD